MPKQTDSDKSQPSSGKSSRGSVSDGIDSLTDSPIFLALGGCGCELLLPLILVGWLLVAVAGATIKAAERVRLVSPKMYPACRASRTAARAGAAAAFIVCGVSGLCAGIGLTCIIYSLESGSSDMGFPAWLLALSAAIAGVSAFLNINLRTAAQSLEAVKPLNNEYADGLPINETLLRGASPDGTTQTQQLLRPASNRTDVNDGRELGHVDGE